MGMEQSEELCWVGKAATGNTTVFGGVGCANAPRPFSMDDMWILTLDPAM